MSKELTECEKLFNAFVNSDKKGEVFQISIMRTSKENNLPLTHMTTCHYNFKSFPVDNYQRLETGLEKLTLESTTSSKNSYSDRVSSVTFQDIQLDTYKKPNSSWFPFF